MPNETTTFPTPSELEAVAERVVDASADVILSSWSHHGPSLRAREVALVRAGAELMAARGPRAVTVQEAWKKWVELGRRPTPEYQYDMGDFLAWLGVPVREPEPPYVPVERTLSDGALLRTTARGNVVRLGSFDWHPISDKSVQRDVALYANAGRFDDAHAMVDLLAECARIRTALATALPQAEDGTDE